MLANDLLAFIITFALALAWLRLNDFAAQRGWVSSTLSRKIIHIGTGPLFVLCWPLYTEAAYARYIAALVPLAITIQFALIGFGVIRDDASVKAMSRTGDRREILRGPLFYGIVFVAMTIFFWLDSPLGIVALMLMCGGDGLADIFGRRFGRTPLPWAARKTWEGTFGMFLGGMLAMLVVLSIYQALGYFPGLLPGQIFQIVIIASVGTLVESLPYHDVDNFTVTLAALIVGALLLG